MPSKVQKKITYDLTPEQLADILAEYFEEWDVLAPKHIKFHISEEKDYRGESMGRKVSTITLELTGTADA